MSDDRGQAESDTWERARALVEAAGPAPGDDDECPCCHGDPDLVCDSCGSHSCWAGEAIAPQAPPEAGDTKEQP